MTTEQQLYRDDQRAREQALDVEHSYIVQAPAGSGKTELLIQRYLRLLGTVENPEEVLAITFTRKAAAEMRLRVLLALQVAQKGERPQIDFEQVTFDAATNVLERDRQFAWALMSNPRRLRIQTLDSLNTSIARMQPMTSGAATGNATVDMAVMNNLYRRAAAATMDWVGDRSRAGEAAEEVLLHIDNNTGIYISYLSRMLRTRDQWLPFISSGSMTDEEAAKLRQRFETSLERVVTEHLTTAAAALPDELVNEILPLKNHACEKLLADGIEASPILALRDIDSRPQASGDALPAWAGLAELLLTRDGGIRKQVDKRIGFPTTDKAMKQRMKDLLEGIDADAAWVSLLHGTRELPPVRYSDEQWQVLQALFNLLPVGVAELKRLAASQGVTDYIEIALSAGTALGTAESPGDVALLLDYQVHHILIDEMQDTSKAQYRMLEALTGGWENGDGRTLFCVGDPMQSIYRFRNAEVSQFLLARENGLGNLALRPLVLRRNFRSGEHLVHWFNTVFPQVLASRDAPAAGAVSYSEAVPTEQHAGQGKFALYPLIGSSREAEASASFAIVQRVLRENPDDTMAILVRSRSVLPSLLRLLRDNGIDYQSVELDRLTDLPEIIDALALTRAFCHDGDRLAWLALLRSPWAGLDWADLQRLVREARHATVYELICDDDRVSTLSATGMEIVRQFRERLRPHLATNRSLSLRQRVENAWCALGGPAITTDGAAVENVYRFFDVLGALEVAGTLPDVAELEQQLDDERVSTQSAARLQVMTMHKAKGLQFDHVLLHGLGRRPRPPQPSILSWFDLPDSHGVEEKVISPIGRRDELAKDPIHRFVERTEAGKDAYENGRLLYVACTRAKRSLHMVGHAEPTRDGSKLSKPLSSTLLSFLWPMVAEQYERAFDASSEAIETAEMNVFAEPVLQRFDKPWSLPELEPVPGQEPDRYEEGAGYEVDYYWVGAEARLAGTIVHRWLQYAAEGRIELRADDLESLRPLSKRWLEELGAGREALEDVSDRVLQALAGVLGDDMGRWLIAGEGAAELALSGMLNGRVESIVIDRIRVADDGTHWIVDYKTSTHEGGGLASFLDAEADRYRGQLSKYASIYSAWTGKPVRCALYFPLLREFVEVEPLV